MRFLKITYSNFILFHKELVKSSQLIYRKKTCFSESCFCQCSLTRHFNVICDAYVDFSSQCPKIEATQQSSSFKLRLLQVLRCKIIQIILISKSYFTSLKALLKRHKDFHYGPWTGICISINQELWNCLSDNLNSQALQVILKQGAH